MRIRVRAVGAIVIGAAMLVSACGSSSKNSSTHSTSTASAPTNTKTAAAFKAGPNPCGLLRSEVIVSTLKQQMAEVQRTKSSCNYMNAGRTESVSISTAKTTRSGADAAVTSTAHTVKGKVLHLTGVGDNGIAYLTTTKKLSIATSLFAKNGTIVFLNVGSPRADHITAQAIALARAAASYTS